MEFKKDKFGNYIFPHEQDDLTLYLRPTANGWWIDPFKVYLIIESIENRCEKIDEACFVAGITRKQYKYFLQEHPVMHERKRVGKFLKRKRDILKKRLALLERFQNASSASAFKYLIFDEHEEYDRRYKSPLACLRRIHGLPAVSPPPKTEHQRLIDMSAEVEKTRIKFGHPSNPEHYESCGRCNHLFNGQRLDI